SRRRHTRFSRDWSSDVCSSDLGDKGVGQYEVALNVRGITAGGVDFRTRPDDIRVTFPLTSPQVVQPEHPLKAAPLAADASAPAAAETVAAADNAEPGAAEQPLP